jgi:hypothetical protein
VADAERDAEATSSPLLPDRRETMA